MKKSFRPLFIAVSILYVSVVASGWIFTKAAGPVGQNSAASGPSTVLLTEDFNYDAGALLTNNGWTAHSAAGTNAILVTSPAPSYPGYAGSGVGNAVTTATSGEDVSNSFSAVTSGTVYAALMVNVTSSQTAGDYFFHVMNFGTTTFRGRVFARKDASTTNFAFGISSSSGTPEYTGNTFVPGTTYLLVVKYTIVDGASNDVVQLFVDPTPGAAEPVATLSATDADASEPAQLSGVGIRQGSASNAAVTQIDGIRVATTWEEAVPTTAGPTPTPTPTETPTPTPTPEPTATAPPPPAPQKANADYNGDGRTDFAIVREGTPALRSSPFAAVGTDPKTRRRQLRKALKQQQVTETAAAAPGDYQWYIAYNGAPDGQTAEWGVAQQDNIVSGDFDGDDKDDLAIWRPGAPDEAGFWWINSTDFTFHFVSFGITGDDTSVVGDYDGDGKDDPAVYRCPQEAGQCHYFYQGSLNNPTGFITTVPWGYGTIDQWVPNSGDFDGDGKYDFCLQDLRDATPGAQAPQWLTLNGPNTAVTYELIDWGTIDDFVIPGDYDGDGRSDFCVLRYEGINMTYWILDRDGDIRFLEWGVDGDLPAPGDYDGDGKQDIAVSRANETDSTFWILPSDGSTYWTFNYGLPTDTPVATWYVQ